MKKSKKVKEKSKRRIVINILMVVMSLLFLSMIFHNQIKYALIDKKASEFQSEINTITSKEIEENRLKPANFDFDQVEPISDSAVLQSNLFGQDSDTFNTVGFVAVPSVSINLPIFQGVANANLFYGAGTVKPDQKMGERNFVLASHRTENPYMLFTPLLNANVGEQIYTTDKQKVYCYTIKQKLQVSPSRGELINDVPNKKLITLITCNDIYAVQRLVVIGEFDRSWKFEETPSEILGVFNIESRTF